MRLIEALTPRGARPKPPALTLQLDTLQAGDSAHDVGVAPTPRTLSRLGKLRQLLTPRGRSGGSRQQLPPDAGCSSPAGSGGLIRAYRPTLTGLMESRALARTAATGAAAAAAPPGRATAAPSDACSDSASEAGSNDSDLSSLDGFGDYARGLDAAPERTDDGVGSTASCPRSDPDRLPSPRQLLAPVQLCTPRASARDTERAAEDLALLLRACELPGSRQRVARMLQYADRGGPDALSGLALQGLGFERCVALLLQLLLPLPLDSRLGVLAALQAKLSTHLLGFLGTSLERVLESERACQRWCRLPFDVAHWLMQHGPCDRGETLFDLGNLWLEQQRAAPGAEQQAALAALVWRRPLAADFLRCMAANLPWAADHVAPSPLRPARLPPSLDGRFSFTAEFELHDLLELQQAAVAAGRPRQQQSVAVYCGGLCWWAALVANPRANRFELYASCSAFSLFQEPYRPALQPAADVRFTFQGTDLSLMDWRQSNAERVEAMHTHWGGPAFWVPPTSPLLRMRSSASSRSMHDGAGSGQLAAVARPDTARGPRPARQMSRLGSLASSASLPESPSLPLPSARSLGGGAPLPSARSSRGSFGGRAQACYSDADSGALTARGPAAACDGSAPLPLSMDQLVAEVRRSSPISWSASLRVRVHIKLLGGGAPQ